MCRTGWIASILVEDQSQLHAGSLERCPDEMRPRVLVAQAEIGAREIGAPQRRSLGQEVGQHHEAIAAGGHRRRELQQRLIGASATAEIGGERRLGPAHDHAAVADRAARDPDGVRERETEQRAGLVDSGLADRHADGATRAERQACDAGVDRARAEVAERAVGRAEHDGRPGAHPVRSAASARSGR